MPDFKRILRDPLIHFLIAGGLLFAVNGWLNPYDARSADEKTITVDEEALTVYLQDRSQAFEPQYFAAAYEAMSPDERQQLVDSYVREEAMARQARVMGLDDVDYVIRQRLIQKILFIVDEASAGNAQPDETQLQEFFAANPELYQSGTEATFTHVFIDDEKAYPGGGEAEARRVQAQLAAQNARFNDATRYGDRFPYLQNYVGRSAEFIANQFGPEFSDALMELEPATGWQGPIRSAFGWHVVLMTGKEAAELPTLDEVREQVRSDYITERVGELRLEALDDLVETYDVRIDLPDGALPVAAER